MRVAREPGLPPDHGCSRRECLVRVIGGGRLAKKKLRDGGRTSSHHRRLPKPEGRVDTRFRHHPLVSLDSSRLPPPLSERRPRRTTRAARLRLGSSIERLVFPPILYSRIPRYFEQYTMSTAATKKRKADSDASSSSASAKAQKSVCCHMFANISLSRSVALSSPPLLHQARRVQFWTQRVWRIALSMVETSGP